MPAPNEPATIEPVDPSMLVRVVMRPMTKVLNPLIRRVAGRRHFFMAGQVHHVGRRSAMTFVTPVDARYHDDSILIPLTFGNRSDWCRNVLAARGCMIRVGGQDYAARDPILLGTEEGGATGTCRLQSGRSAGLPAPRDSPVHAPFHCTTGGRTGRMIGRRDSESTEVELLTERLRVRPLDEGDRTALAAILGDADVMRFVGAGRPLGPEEIDDWLAHARRAHRDQGLGPFSVCLAQGGAVIGYCGIWTGEDTGELELNDALAPTYCGRGFGQEAAGAVLRYADRRLDVIRATADPTNAPSLRILERLGFTRTHTAPDVHGLPTVFLARRRPPSSRPDDAGRSANTTRRELSREPNQEPTTARPGKHPGRPATPGTPPRA